MSSGLYAAFSGWLARSEALDSAASNLANAGTQGFRAEREYFRSAIMGPDAQGDQLDRTVNNFGVLGGNQLDLGQGALTTTGNPLDVAIEGQGFFAIQTKNGIRYTRDGSFQRARDGTLITAQGEPVLNAQNQPIRIPTGDITIGSDGVISVDGARRRQSWRLHLRLGNVHHAGRRQPLRPGQWRQASACNRRRRFIRARSKAPIRT